MNPILPLQLAPLASPVRLNAVALPKNVTTGIQVARVAVGQHPQTGLKEDRYQGILPQKVSPAQKLFGMSLIFDRGTKSIMDVFKAYGKYVNGQISFSGQEMGNPVSSLLKDIMHGDASPVTNILPQALQQEGPFSDDQKQMGLEVSSNFEAYYAWGKLGAYGFSMATSAMSLINAKNIKDAQHKTNVIQKNIGILTMCGGFFAEKIGLIGASYLVASGQYDLAAMTLGVSKVFETIGYSGAMYAAGPIVRDTTHELAVKQVREEVKRTLKKVNKDERVVKRLVLDEVGPHHTRVAATLKSKLSKSIRNELKELESQKSIFKRWIDKVPFLKKEPQLSQNSVVALNLILQLEEIEKQYQTSKDVPLAKQQTWDMLMLIHNQVSILVAPSPERTALLSEIQMALEGLNQQEITSDPDLAARFNNDLKRWHAEVFEYADVVMAKIHDRVVEVSKIRAPMDRSIIEKIWYVKDTLIARKNKYAQMNKVYALEEEIESLINDFQEFAAQRILQIRHLKSLVDEEGALSFEADSLQEIKNDLVMSQQKGRLNLSEIGAANSRLYDAIPRAAQAVAFLTLGGMAYMAGTDAFDICQIIKGGQDLPLYIVGAMGLVTAIGPFQSLKKDLQERKKAHSAGKESDKLYASINAIGNGIKLPGSMLIAHPVTHPLGLAVYAAGVGVESMGLVYPHRKKWRIYRYLSEKFGLG